MDKTHFNFDTIMEMDRIKRAHFINSIGGFKSVCLIGTIDKANRTNLAIFNSIVHIGANPPLISFIMRPDSVERHTLNNILETGCYSINHINETFFKKAHQTSAKYPKDLSEFDAVGLNTEFKNSFIAPFVKESNVQLALAFRERINLSINNTIMIIGEIQDVYFPMDCMEEDGFLNIEKAGTIACTGLDCYHTTHRIERLDYARP